MIKMLNDLRKVYPAKCYIHLFFIYLLLTLCWGCKSNDNWNETKRKIEPETDIESQMKIMLIGLDGGEWKVIFPLLRMGKLPVIEKVIGKGVAGKLISENPIISPAIWTTIATGKSRQKHGIDSFVKIDPEKSEAKPVSRNLRKCKALWNIVSENGFSTGVIGWWVTWPAEEINGYIISDRFWGGSEMEGVAYPSQISKTFSEFATFKRTEINKEISDIIPDFKVRMDNKSFGTDQVNFNIFELYFQVPIDLVVERFANHFLKLSKPDVFMMLYRTIDSSSHFYWKYYDADFDYLSTGISQEEMAYLADMIPRAYQYLDKKIEFPLECVSEETAIFIVSDHGFGWERDRAKRQKIYNMDILLERLGYLKFQKSDIDYSKTLAFDIMGAGGRQRNIYINLRSRASYGIVDTEVQYQKISSDLSTKLKELKTTNGKKVFSSVLSFTEISENSFSENADPAFIMQKYQNNIIFSLYSRIIPDKKGELTDHEKFYFLKDDKLMHSPPDIVAIFNAELRSDDHLLIDGNEYQASNFIKDVETSGDHRIEGIIIAAGDKIRHSINFITSSIYNITPTILYLLNLPVAKDMDGRVLEEIINDDYLKINPINYIPTYETLSPTAKPTPLKSNLDTIILEQLKTLGYIE